MFGRRRAQPTAPAPREQMGYLALAPVTPTPVSSAHIGGTAGWKALPGWVAGPQQIGAYAGGLLNQYPAILPGVQRLCGTEGLSSRWATPTPGVVALGGLTQTTRPNNVTGAQRYGSVFSGSIGPISAQANAAAVTAAQIKQSGLAAMQFAKRLSPSYNALIGGQ